DEDACVRGGAEGEPTHASGRDLEPEEPRMALAHHELRRRDRRRVAGRLPQHCRCGRSREGATGEQGRGRCAEMTRPRSSGGTPFQRSLPPVLPPGEPQARKSSRTSVPNTPVPKYTGASCEIRIDLEQQTTGFFRRPRRCSNVI